jgi:uncharacterized phiE125 gp8 family phage protein
MRRMLHLVTPPSVEPITLIEAKNHLNLEITEDDAYVTDLITVARQYAEKITWRGLLQQTWELTMNGFPCGDVIELPKGDLIGIDSVQYRDSNNNVQTLDPAVYEADLKSIPGRMILADSQTWPATRGRWNDVVIQYKVGFGNVAAAVPKPIKQAMQLLIGQLYETRTLEVTGTIISKVGFAFDALIAPYRLRRF